MTDLARLVVRLEAQSGKYLAELEKANAKLAQFGKKTDSVLKGIADGFAVYLSGKAIGEFIGGIVNTGDELFKMSQKTGVSVEALSQLQHAIELSGGSLETLEKGFIKLSKAAVEAAKGGKEAQEAFGTLGVTFKNQDGTIRKSEDLLLDIAERFSQLEDGPGKAAVAMQLFGKAGAQLIPFLNEGAAGIRELMQEADQLGLTMSTDAAKAAEAYNDNMERLGKVVKGITTQALSKILPILEDLSAEMVDSAKSTDSLSTSSERLAYFFKVLIAGGILLKDLFVVVGTAIGGVAAAAATLFQNFNAIDFSGPVMFGAALARNFKDVVAAGSILSQTFKDIKSTVGSDLDRINAIWNGTAGKVQEVEVSVKKLKETLSFEDPKIAEALRKELQKALDTLTKFDAQLAEQVATFGLAESEVVAYRLAVGDLSDEVKKTGESGKALAVSIQEQANALERLKNAEAVKQLDLQIMELTGHTREAALAAFDLQNAMLKRSLETSGDTKGLETLGRLRELTAAQAEYNDLQRQASDIQAELGRQEERIQNSVLTGARTELDAMSATGEARKNAVAQLDEILRKMQAIAEASGNPALKQQAEDMAVSLEKLAIDADVVGQQVRGTLKEGFGQFFKDSITGAKNLEDAFLGALQRIQDKLLDMILNNYVDKLFASFSSSPVGGGILGAIGGLFGGSRDSGGAGKPGYAYAIGRGAQPELFVPGMSGQFIPRDKWMGGGGITQNFAIQAPQGTVSRQTQLQVGAEAARGISQANRRNNR